MNHTDRMNQLVPLPLQKAYVRAGFIQQADDVTPVPCYLAAVEVVLNEALRWMVLTEEGACYNSVPLHALCLRLDAPPVEKLSDVATWDSLGDRAEVIEIPLLRHMTMATRHGRARYMFSIHFEADRHWSRVPEQLKVFHIAERDDGNLIQAVNNETRFLMDAFDQPDRLRHPPRANTRTWFAE